MLTVATPEEEKRRLSALRSLGVLDTPPEPELDIITALAADRFEAPIALISLVDEERQWFKSRVGLDAQQTERSVAYCGYTIQTDEVFAVLDASADERFCNNPLVIGGPTIRFYAGTPLVLSGGARVGSLCVIDTKARKAFTERDRRALRLMARQVVNHLETRRIHAAQRISQLIADTTTDAFVCCGPDGRITYWNRGAEKTFGFSDKEAIGETLEIIVPSEHVGAHEAGLRRMVAGGPARLVGKTIEVPAVRKDGSHIMTELTLGMWKDPKTGLPAGFASIIRDVSLRKATEAKLAEQVAAIEASHEGISIAGIDGVQHYMNDAFLRLFGLSENGAAVSWSQLFAPDDRDRLMTELMGKLAESGSWTGEARGLKTDGSLFEIELSLTRRDQSIVGVVRDITARRAEARERSRLREQLLVAQRQEAVGELASGLAHDFNNLIAAISGSAALIRSMADDECGRHAARIEAAASNAASLVDKMLSLGKRTRNFEAHDARGIGRDVRDLLRISLSSGHRLHLELDAEPVMLTADRTELMQVILNLGLNARDALQDISDAGILIAIRQLAAGPADVDLTLGVMPAGPVVHFRVSDTGCGMPVAEIRNIFQPFYTRKAGSGTGLGLAMVANIIDSASAGLMVTSELGQGTCFDIYWPLNPPPENEHATAAADGAMDIALSGLTILLADDEPAIVETLSAMLERAGAEVGPCLDAHDALAALHDDPDAWSLLVTDYDMPGMDGAALATAAREIRADLPILLITALPDAPRARAKEGELFDAISGKLISVSGLINAVQTAISNRRARIE